MHLIILCLVGLVGAALALRFKVIVLVPATVLVALVVTIAGLTVGNGLRTIALYVVANATALQVGYLVGLLLCSRFGSASGGLTCMLMTLIPLGALAFSPMMTGDGQLPPMGFVRFCVERPQRCTRPRRRRCR